MITPKIAEKDLPDGIRKGETYVQFTGKDADYIKRAAKKVHMSEEDLLNKAWLMFIEDHDVRAVACNNGDVEIS